MSTAWRDFIAPFEKHSDEHLRNIRQMLRDKQDNGLAQEMDNAADFVLFTRSSRWEYLPDENPRAHTPECIERYARDIDANQRNVDEEAAYEKRWGATSCKYCYGMGMIAGRPGTWEDPPEDDEVCTHCLGREIKAIDEDGVPVTGEYGQVYVNAPMCPRCAAVSTILFDENTPFDDVSCRICGWKMGDGAPFNDYDMPECTCRP